MFIKSMRCKYCKTSFAELNRNQRANHSRWCDLNPKRKDYIKNLENSRSLITNHRNQYMKAKDEGREVPVSPCKDRPGHFLGKTHSEETKQVLREKALASPHRRLVRSIQPYSCKDGSNIMLDSSWEVALAKRLDYLNIDWIRPAVPMIWIDSKNQSRHYFPDFYLPKYNLYLDPKNPAAFKAQKEKIDWLLSNVENLIFLHSLKECEEFIGG